MFRTFAKNVGFTLIGQIGSIFLAIIVSVVLARFLGPERRGVLAIVLLVPACIEAVFASGFSPTIIHHVAAGKWKNATILPLVFGLWIYLSSILAIFGALAAYACHVSMPNIPTGPLILALSLMPLRIFQQCLYAVLSGKEQFKIRMNTGLKIDLANCVLIVALVAVLGWGVWGAVIGYAFGFLVSIAMLGYQVRSIVGTNTIFSLSAMRWTELREPLSFGYRSQAGSIANFLNYRIDQLIVNAVLGPVNTGIYAVAVSTAERIWMLVNNVSLVLFPAASRPHSDLQSIDRFTARLAAMMLLVLTCMGLVFALLAEAFCVLLFGEAYRESGYLIRLLIPGIVLLGQSKIMSNYIAGRGRPGINAWGAVIALVINVVLNVLAIPRFGTAGAALATSVSYSFQSLFIYFTFVRLSGLSWTAPFLPSRSDVTRLKGIVSTRWHGSIERTNGS